MAFLGWWVREWKCEPVVTQMFEKVTSPTKSGSFDDPGLESPEKLRKKLLTQTLSNSSFHTYLLGTSSFLAWWVIFLPKHPPIRNHQNLWFSKKKTSMNVYGKNTPGKFRPSRKNGSMERKPSHCRLPSRELTYPPKMAFWRWFSFSQGGIC